MVDLKFFRSPFAPSRALVGAALVVGAAAIAILASAFIVRGASVLAPIPAPTESELQALTFEASTTTHGVAVRASVDSARAAVVVMAGPFRVPPAQPVGDGRSLHEHFDPVVGTAEAIPLRFDWPVDGWVRGFELRFFDARGALLDPALVHHVVVINFDRRDLIYPTVERLMGIAPETGDVVLPSSIGVPMTRGQRMGIYAVWHNQTGTEIEAFFRLVIRLTPADQRRRPQSVFPVKMDVKHLPGGSSAFDLPPGKSSQTFEFDIPVDGKLLAATGHLHDYGLSVRLEEAATGRSVVTVRAIRDSSGRVSAVEQKKGLGFLWRGIRLHAERRYRVVGEYDNPGPETLRGMTQMLAVFAPAEGEELPAIDVTNPDYRIDVAGWDLGVPSAEFMRTGAARPR